MSDLSMIRMVNHLFGKNYTDDQYVIKYFEDEPILCISMIIGGTDQYTCYVPYFEFVPQIYIREGGYVTALHFKEQEQVTVTDRMYILMDCSARKLEKEGLILFLPLLFYCFREKEQNSDIKREVLKYFIFRDIVGALHDSMKKGDISVYDAEKLKQLCGYMAWKMLLGVKWMQSLELQELLMEAFSADIELLERTHQRELDNIRNK